MPYRAEYFNIMTGWKWWQCCYHDGSCNLNIRIAEIRCWNHDSARVPPLVVVLSIWEEQPRHGAGAVLAGVRLSQRSADPVRVGDLCSHQANAVVIESVPIGSLQSSLQELSWLKDVPENVVVTGVPAHVIKSDTQTQLSCMRMRFVPCNCK